jgi:hypothetical protein
VGQRYDRITQEKVKALYYAFRRADFFSLCSSYKEGTVDAPAIELTLAYDRWGKYVGDRADTEGMPLEAAKLPGMIDALTNTAHWIGHPDPKCMYE